MRIRDNKLESLHRFFHEELSGVYDQGEINALFFTAAEHVLGWSRLQIARRLPENINQSDVLKLYDCAKALARHEPLQYILGTAYFMDMPLRVSRHVLIPRPETEELVRLVLDLWKGRNARVLDIGTGSGCIALAVKRERSAYEVRGCDISSEALDIARSNARTLDLDVDFFLLDALSESAQGMYDIVISNPPYITPDEARDMGRHVLDHEPHLALFAPRQDPILFYKKIADLCRECLHKGGLLFFELNPETAELVLSHIRATKHLTAGTLVTDMSGKKRFLHARRV